jgi:hypothetical protein
MSNWLAVMPSRVTGGSLAALAAGLFLALPGVAAAQERGSKLEAEKEQPPKLEPIGARIGAFRAFINVDVNAVYDDNVYAQDTAKRDDVYAKISPSVRLVADNSQYKAKLTAGIDRYEYSKLDAESRTDWNVGGEVVAELLRDTSVTLNAGFRRATEERGAPDSPVSARSPVRYESFTAGGGLSREVGRLQLRTLVDYEKLNFDDGRLGNGGVINNDDRDRQYISGGAEISYEFSPGYRIYGRGLVDRVAYRIPFDDTGFNRDGKGYRLTGGVKFDITNVIAGSVFAGYMRRNYKDPRFTDYGGIAYGASIVWNPTRLTSVYFDANRGIQETTQVGYRGFISTNAGVRVEHDLTRFIQLRAGLRYDKNKYLLTSAPLPLPIARDDDLIFANIGLNYLLSRQVSFGASYEYGKRSSNAPAADYTRNKAIGYVKLTF